MATHHDPARTAGGAAADTAATATIWSIAQEAVGQVRDAIGRLLRGGNGEDGNQNRLTPNDPELRNLDDKLQHEVRQFVGSDASAQNALAWVRYGIQLLARTTGEGDIARAVQAQRTIGAIRLINAGQVVQFATAVSEAHGRGGDSEAVLAALAFADVFSRADPQTGAAILALSRVERMGRAVLDGIRALPARLAPAADTLAHVAGRATATTSRILVGWLVWIAIFGAATLVVGARVQRFDDWMVVGLLAIVGYILPTAIVPALLAEGIELVLGAVYGVVVTLQGALRLVGVNPPPARRDEHRETLAQRVSDFRGKLILPAALGIATWFAMWSMLAPSGVGSMVVALIAALLGAAVPWVLKGEEREHWARNALVGTTILVAVGFLAAAIGGGADIGAYKGGLFAAPLQTVAHGLWALLGVAGGKAQGVASQSAYGSALVIVAILAVVAMAASRKWVLAALAAGLLLWTANQGDREVSRGPIHPPTEEDSLLAAEAASQERDDVAEERAQRQLLWSQEAYAHSLELARQNAVAAERSRLGALEPRR